MEPIDYLVLGHVTHDLLPDGARGIGGTASYAALTAAALGRRVGVLTSAGADFDAGLLERIAQVTLLRAPATTTFENRYIDGQRQQFWYTTALPLILALLPGVWQGTPLVHIGPVAGECDPALVAHFAGRTFVGLTPQGWMRRADASKRVLRTPWADAERLLPLASAAVLSIEDVAGDWEIAHRFARWAKTLVITQGREGARLFVEGKPQAIAAPAVVELDPTGAGDIFASAFFIALSGGAEPEPAAHFATCLAARSVTRPGLDAAPRPSDIAACTQHLS